MAHAERVGYEQHVHDDAIDIPGCNLATTSCGQNALFSQYGTVEQPYLGWIVPTNITNNQNNGFTNNTYVGPWNFMPFCQSDGGTDFAAWQSGFTDDGCSTGIHVNGQDSGSSYNGNSPPPTTTTTTGGSTTTTGGSTTTTGGSTTTTGGTPPPQSAHGYRLVGSDGGIFTFGSAQFYGSTGNIALQRPVVGIAPTAGRGGYWLVASDWRVFAFGDAVSSARSRASVCTRRARACRGVANAPIVGMAPSVTGKGYFMVASDGGVFAFGDAHFAGSCPGTVGCSGTAVAVMPDASGDGYWVVTKAGSVYAFGDAAYYGVPSHGLVTSAVRTPDGRGYWILLRDGEVFSYGDAVNFGSPAAGNFNALNFASAYFFRPPMAGGIGVVRPGQDLHFRRCSVPRRYVS